MYIVFHSHHSYLRKRLLQAALSNYHEKVVKMIFISKRSTRHHQSNASGLAAIRQQHHCSFERTLSM